MKSIAAVEPFRYLKEKPKRAHPALKIVMCPYCGSSELEAEYVDIGVGTQQCTPMVCLQCGAQEIPLSSRYNNEFDNLSGVEKLTGWYKGG